MARPMVEPKLNTARGFAEALRYVLGASSFNMTQLSQVIGERDDYVSWLLSPLRPVPQKNAPKTCDAEIAARIAEAVAGKGQLIGDWIAIFHFLLGVESDPRAVLVPSLRLVGTDGEASKGNVSSVSPHTVLGGYRTPESGLKSDRAA